MSGTELLGVIAAAAQLAEYSLKIISLIAKQYTKHQRSLDRFKSHQINFHDLISIAGDIQQNTALHTNFISEQLNATLDEAKRLSILLSHDCSDPSRLSVKKYWIWIGYSSEDVILEGLNRLEKQKSGLHLRISVTQARISSENTNRLRDIQESLAGLSAMSQPPNNPQNKRMSLGSYALTLEVIPEDRGRSSQHPTSTRERGRSSSNTPNFLNPEKKTDGRMAIGLHGDSPSPNDRRAYPESTMRAESSTHARSSTHEEVPGNTYKSVGSKTAFTIRGNAGETSSSGRRHEYVSENERTMFKNEGDTSAKMFERLVYEAKELWKQER